jgi:tyrosyl-tRNA synthetase
MDPETRFELIQRVGEEIITKPELLELLERKKHPIAYDGFEPSGLAPIHFGVYRAINLEDLLAAGIRFKLWLADWFAWVNDKMGGDLPTIRKVGEYFIEVWKAAGIDMSKVEVLWASDAMDSRDYWRKVIQIAKNTTINRTIRCLTIMGRTKTDLKMTAQLFYPMMQCADIFHLEADICQLGLDQRRANMLAREVGPKLGWWKPVIVSHHMLMGLEGKRQPEGYDENQAFDQQISSKMSKSRPDTCIYVHDSLDAILNKIQKAFCPPKTIEGNPILEYCKYIIYRKCESIEISRSARYGGDLEIPTYEELTQLYATGAIHPLDLKKAVARSLDTIIAPIREHFEKHPGARKLYQFVKQENITR